VYKCHSLTHSYRILSEVECLRSIPQVSLILLQTPHHMCDASLDGVYRSALSPTNIADTVTQCATRLHSFTALSTTQSHDLCSDGAFTGANTAKLAARMRSTLKTFSCSRSTGDAGYAHTHAHTPVCLIDSHLMTAALPNCSAATEDGRHYNDNILLEEVKALKGYLTAQHLWTGST
jgi:hypothetical protein